MSPHTYCQYLAAAFVSPKRLRRPVPAESAAVAATFAMVFAGYNFTGMCCPSLYGFYFQCLSP